MKKMGWFAASRPSLRAILVSCVVGAVVIFGAALLIGRESMHGTRDGITEDNAVSEVAVLSRMKRSDSVEGADGGRGENTGWYSPNVSPAVQTITGKDADYKTRLNAMKGLGYGIAPQDVAVLMEFLAAQIPLDSKLRPISFNAIRNDALELLLKQRQMPDGMGTLLTDVYNNPRQDAMWRNYCLQFMSDFYERARANGAMPSPAAAGNGAIASPDRELQLVQESMWQALGERGNSNAGTALLGLEKLSRNHAEIDREQVNAAMLELAVDESASVANRISAIRLCVEHGNIQALETARNLAGNGDTTMIRCAAIATLGELGVDEDRALLETYAASSDKRIQRMAQHSLGKFSSK